MKKLQAYKVELEAKTVAELKKMAKESPQADEYFDMARLGKIRKRHYVDALVFAKCIKSGSLNKCIFGR